jgi:hypothetical protein
MSGLSNFSSSTSLHHFNIENKKVGPEGSKFEKKKKDEQ